MSDAKPLSPEEEQEYRAALRSGPPYAALGGREVDRIFATLDASRATIAADEDRLLRLARDHEKHAAAIALVERVAAGDAIDYRPEPPSCAWCYRDAERGEHVADCPVSLARRILDGADARRVAGGEVLPVKPPPIPLEPERLMQEFWRRFGKDVRGVTQTQDEENYGRAVLRFDVSADDKQRVLAEIQAWIDEHVPYDRAVAVRLQDAIPRPPEKP